MVGVLGNSKEARGWGRKPRGEACRMRWKEVRRVTWAGGTQTSVTEGLGVYATGEGKPF